MSKSIIQYYLIRPFLVLHKLSILYFIVVITEAFREYLLLNAVCFFNNHHSGSLKVISDANFSVYCTMLDIARSILKTMRGPSLLKSMQDMATSSQINLGAYLSQLIVG